METGCDTGLFQQFADDGTSFIIAGHTKKAAGSAQCSDIARDIGGSAQTFLVFADQHNRNRCFRRYAVDITEPVTIEHDVADDQYAGIFLVLHIRC